MQFFVYCLMWCAILVFMEKFFPWKRCECFGTGKLKVITIFAGILVCQKREKYLRRRTNTSIVDRI